MDHFTDTVLLQVAGSLIVMLHQYSQVWNSKLGMSESLSLSASVQSTKLSVSVSILGTGSLWFLNRNKTGKNLMMI